MSAAEPPDGHTGIISLILPVYNEAENIAACLRGLWAALRDSPHEILVCYDSPGDSTLPAIEQMSDRPPTVRLVRNDLGPGVAWALRAGFRAAAGDVVVTTMADLSDPPEIIPAMAEKVRAGAAVVAGSRYMKGGSQAGGPLLKRILSRLAGLSLRWLAGLRTHDATGNFRAYSAEFLRGVKIESTHGFELALELTVKAHLAGLKVDEVPSSWRDRSAGRSRFRLWKWMPRYLRWYGEALSAPAFVWLVWVAMCLTAFSWVWRHGVDLPYWDEWENVPKLTGAEPVTAEWLWSQHNEHRIPLPRLLWLGLLALSGGDFRAGMYFNAATMAALAAAMVLAVRRLRGRTSYADAFFPIVWLHGAHYENLLWSFQVAFLLSGGLSALILLCIVWRRGVPTLGQLATIGASVLLLPLCGANGAVLVPGLALWMAYAGVTTWKSRSPAARLAGVTALAMAVAAGGAFALYVWGYHSCPHHPPSPEINRTARAALGVLGTGAATPDTDSWRLVEVLTALFCVAAAASIVRSWALDAKGRVRTLGMLAVLGSVCLLAGAIGWGRAGLGLEAARSSRYAVLMAPALCCAYCAWDLSGSRATARFMQMAAFTLLCAGLFSSFRAMKSHGSRRRDAARALIEDVRRGLPVAEIAERHGRNFHPDTAVLAKRLEMLRRAGLGPYRR